VSNIEETQHAIMETYGELKYYPKSGNWSMTHTVNGEQLVLNYESIPSMYQHIKRTMFDMILIWEGRK
jgi:uncharacterized membrane protein YcaP (DUF421 family)